MFHLIFQNESEVAIEFCSVYSLLHWATFPICPLTLFFLSWHLLLSSRRAEDRALRVPKHATSIFLMMLPLATAIFDSTKTKPASSSQSSLVRLTAEQKRKVTTLVELETKVREDFNNHVEGLY